jgi:hypothetical protein
LKLSSGRKKIAQAEATTRLTVTLPTQSKYERAKKVVGQSSFQVRKRKLKSRLKRSEATGNEQRQTSTDFNASTM